MTATETKNIEKPRQFAFHDRVSSTPPSGGTMVDFFNRLANGEELTREEKNTVFHELQSNGGKGYYRLAGWSFNFRQFMSLYLVKHTYDNHWVEIWAFDKTCIRSSFYTKSDIAKIIKFPEQ
jgi:hypothetical protein